MKRPWPWSHRPCRFRGFGLESKGRGFFIGTGREDLAVTHRALLETDLPGLPKRKGKVRDIYDLGDRLLLVATDRISAFDWVLPNGIPDKGRVLNGLSVFWFEKIAEGRWIDAPTHLLSADIGDAVLDLSPEARANLVGRLMLVRKVDVIPFECVVRGYLAGSGWREYQATRAICGQELPAGLVEADKIETLFTPATKAETGHDQNVPLTAMDSVIGSEMTERLEWESTEVYQFASRLALSKGLILADTKFEWGYDRTTGELTLIDEVLTPDSSRYWPLDGYKPGGPQPSFDKQFVRDWLESTGWDKASPPPPLPDHVIAKTRAKYIEAYEILTGHPFPWK
jgi:phosphoribosylaminoimidazole-succinocarboxamide synthase